MSGQDTSTGAKKPEKPGNPKRKTPEREAPVRNAPPRNIPRTPQPGRKMASAGKKAQKRKAQGKTVSSIPDAASQTSRKPAGAVPVPKPKPFKRKASPAKKQQIAAVLLLLLTLYLLINLAVFGILLFDFNRQPGDAVSYSLVLKKNGSKVAAVDAAQANNGNGLYVPYSKLSLIADLSIMGDSENVQIIVRPGNDRIEINNNSSLIYINDNAIRLSKPVIFQLNDYLLPIELISSYMDGITIAYNDKNSTCTLSRSTENNAVVAAKIAVPDGLDKCSIPPEPTPSQTSSDTSSDTASDVSRATSSAGSGTTSTPSP